MVSERAQAGSRQNQRRATRGSQGILCPAYNSMMQTLPRAVARGLLFAFLRAVWAGKLDGQAPPSANAMKCAEISFLPFHDDALQFPIRRCARGSGRSRFRLLRAHNARPDRNTTRQCDRYTGSTFFVLYGSVPRLPLPAVSSDTRRNACLQEHFDEAAHEPRRGEVPTWEKCLLAGAFRRCGARAPSGRSQQSEESSRSLSLTRRSLTFVRDDVRGGWNDTKTPLQHPENTLYFCGNPVKGGVCD